LGSKEEDQTYLHHAQPKEKKRTRMKRWRITSIEIRNTRSIGVQEISGIMGDTRERKEVSIRRLGRVGVQEDTDDRRTRTTHWDRRDHGRERSSNYSSAIPKNDQK
jgi:hypothetical protein